VGKPVSISLSLILTFVFVLSIVEEPVSLTILAPAIVRSLAMGRSKVDPSSLRRRLYIRVSIISHPPALPAIGPGFIRLFISPDELKNFINQLELFLLLSTIPNSFAPCILTIYEAGSSANLSL